MSEIIVVTLVQDSSCIIGGQSTVEGVVVFRFALKSDSTGHPKKPFFSAAAAGIYEGPPTPNPIDVDAGAQTVGFRGEISQEWMCELVVVSQDKAPRTGKLRVICRCEDEQAVRQAMCNHDAISRKQANEQLILSRVKHAKTLT